MLFPNDTEKLFNLVLSHLLQVVLSSPATVKADLIWHFAWCDTDISF